MFDVVFRGDIVMGHNLPDVKLRLQQLFKTDAAKIDTLFSGRPVPLKKNLDETSAKKYQVALMRAGAEVSLVPSGKGTPKVAPKPVPAMVKSLAERLAEQPEAPEVKAPASTPITPGLTLAAAGADVLNPNERSQQLEVSIDVSAISIRPNEGNLLDATEVKHDAVPSIQMPDFDVAEAGAILVRDDEKTLQPIVEVDIESWDLNEAGADLLNADERVEDVLTEIPDLQVDLAPAGSDLGQLKEKVIPVNPDISQLKLVDE